jgi:DNA-binding LacI/PurR family transcriptional regulator
LSTIADVAREAGVSVATVSRALRGLDRVSPETRDRVMQVAEDLHYVASPTATSLASGRTRVVAVVTPFLNRWYFATLMSAIGKTLRDHGHHVLLFDLEGDYHNRLELTREMLWKRSDGVIVLNIPLLDREVDLLDRVGLPTVAVGTPLPGRPLVAIDDAEATRLATTHLIDLGHRHIAYVGAAPVNVTHSRTPRTRFGAFREVMAAHRIPVRESWVVPAEWSARSARDRIEPVLAADFRPTAVVAASDEMAIGVLTAATHLGVSVPDELSVIGIDDHPLSDVLGLTTARQDVEAQGRLAAELLVDSLLGGQSLSGEALILPVELVVRSTTGPVPVSPPAGSTTR